LNIKKIVITALLFFISIVGYSQEWLTNFDDATAIAQKENKNIFMVFSGSDWCAPCIKLEKYIWESNDFKQHANKNWILLKLDFPKRKANKLSKELQSHNDALAEKYNNNGYFPLVLVLDKNGNVLGETGYKKITAQAYVNELIAFEK